MEIQIPKVEEEPKLEEEREVPEPVREEIIEKIRTSNLEDDLGFIEVVSTIPTHTPIHPLKRIILYVSGTTYRLYVFDVKTGVWRYVTLT